MKKHLKDYFIPHEGNDYKPHSLQKAAFVGLSAMVILSFAVTNVQSLLWIGSDWLVSTVLPAVIVDLTNQERDTAALGELTRNSVLDAAATLKAQDMAKNEYFAHFSPTNVSPWYWFSQVNYNFIHAGENLAIHFTDSADVVGAWMDSPTHRANIMNGNYTEIGVGTAEGTFEGYKTVYVVQLFGTPVSAAAASKSATVATVPATAEPVTVVDKAPVQVASAVDTAVLSENVNISEQVNNVPPEPKTATITEIKELPDTADVVASDTNTTVVADVQIDKNGEKTLYSDHMSTSTGVASIDPTDVSQVHAGSTNFLTRLATQPHKVLQILYSMIALFVIGSLLLSILVEIRRQNPIQLAYSMALFLLMFGLYQAHVLMSSGVLIV